MTQLFMVHPGPLPSEPETVPGVHLRPATEDDVPALSLLLAEAYAEPWPTPRVRAELFDAPDVVATWLLESTEGLVATASERLLPELYPNAGYLHWVGTSAAARGQGFGRLVTIACLAGFAARGLPGAVLETDDFRGPAVRTYLRLGFVPDYRDEGERTAWSALFPELFGAPSGRERSNG